MNKAKRLIMALAVLAAIVAPVVAAETMSVTWQWGHDDANVNYYRYQVNNESDDGWTVVPSSVLSYDATELDPYQSYTLYLQCSYDGENWSESAVAVAEPLLVKGEAEAAPAKEEPVSTPSETTVAAESTKAEASETSAPVAAASDAPAKEEPVVVAEEAAPEAKKAKSDYGFKANLLITGGVDTNVAYNDFKLDGTFPRVGIALDLQNIVHAGHWGLGLRFDVNSILQPEAQNWDNYDIKKPFTNIWYDSSADAKLMMYLGGSAFDFYLGGGAGYSIFNPHFTEGSAEETTYGHSLGKLGPFSTAWFVSGNVGMRVRFNRVFSLGAEVNYRYLLPAEKHTASADLVLGFTF